jgi:CRP-like cAMP-binding protein
MATTLQQTISQLAADFAAAVYEAVKRAPLADAAAGIPAGRGRKAGGTRARSADRTSRLRRRSEADITKTINAIVGLLKKNPKGLRSEHIQAQLGLAKNEVPRPLAKALAAGAIRKKGEKRSTTYFAR